MQRNLFTWKKSPRVPWISGRVTKTQPPVTSTNTVEEVMEISHDKSSPMPDKSAFIFHHNFYPKPEVDLKDVDITQGTRQKLLTLQQNHNDIVSKYNSDIGLIHLEQLKIDTDQNLPSVASKPYP